MPTFPLEVFESQAWSQAGAVHSGVPFRRPAFLSWGWEGESGVSEEARQNLIKRREGKEP